MQADANTVERAFELARTGEFKTVEKLKTHTDHKPICKSSRGSRAAQSLFGCRSDRVAAAKLKRTYTVPIALQSPVLAGNIRPSRAF